MIYFLSAWARIVGTKVKRKLNTEETAANTLNVLQLPPPLARSFFVDGFDELFGILGEIANYQFLAFEICTT